MVLFYVRSAFSALHLIKDPRRVFFILACYFLFGYIYKSSVLGLRGIEAVPHGEFWSAALEQCIEGISSLWMSVVRKDDGRGTYEQI